MPHSHGIDNHNVRFCRKSRKLDHDSWDPDFLANSAACSLQIVGVCKHIRSRADSDNGNGMMAMMLVLVMVIIVTDALRQVDSVHQHSCQTFHKLRDLDQAKALCGKPNSSQSMHLSGAALKHYSVMRTSSSLSRRL